MLEQPEQGTIPTKPGSYQFFDQAGYIIYVGKAKNLPRRVKIKKFIIELRKSEFKVIENPLSTHIYGEYYSLMEFLKNAIASSIIGQEAVIINIKIIKGNRSGYVPSF